jgi:hypothetical protein
VESVERASSSRKGEISKRKWEPQHKRESTRDPSPSVSLSCSRYNFRFDRSTVPQHPEPRTKTCRCLALSLFPPLLCRIGERFDRSCSLCRPGRKRERIPFDAAWVAKKDEIKSDIRGKRNTVALKQNRQNGSPPSTLPPPKTSGPRPPGDGETLSTIVMISQERNRPCASAHEKRFVCRTQKNKGGFAYGGWYDDMVRPLGMADLRSSTPP